MSGRCLCAFERTQGTNTDDEAPVWEMDDCIGGEKLRVQGFLTPLLLATTDMNASTLRVVSLPLRKVVFERAFEWHTSIQSVWCDGEAIEPNGMWLLVKGTKEREKNGIFVERLLVD